MNAFKYAVCLASLVAIVSPAKAATITWKTYVDPNGVYKINYPAGWKVLTKGNALVITSPGGPEDRGVFGITPRAAGTKVKDAVAMEFDDPNRAPDLQQSPAKLAGLPATKVWGSKKGDDNIRVVEYYVQKDDVPYYILFQAPHGAMTRYSPLFNAMIGSMKFLQ